VYKRKVRTINASPQSVQQKHWNAKANKLLTLLVGHLTSEVASEMISWSGHMHVVTASVSCLDLGMLLLPSTGLALCALSRPMACLSLVRGSIWTVPCPDKKTTSAHPFHSRLTVANRYAGSCRKKVKRSTAGTLAICGPSYELQRTLQPFAAMSCSPKTTAARPSRSSSQ